MDLNKFNQNESAIAECDTILNGNIHDRIYKEAKELKRKLILKRAKMLAEEE